MLIAAVFLLAFTTLAAAQATAPISPAGKVESLSPWIAFFLGLLPLIIDKILTYIQSTRKMYHEDKLEEAKSLKQETESFRRELREENERLRDQVDALETKKEIYETKRQECEEKYRQLQELLRKMRIDPDTGKLTCARAEGNCPFGKTLDDVPELEEHIDLGNGK